MHHSTTQDKRVPGHSLVESLYVLLGQRCPLAPQLYRQQAVCKAEGVPFASKIDLMETVIRTFEPVAGTVTHILLDTWYSAKRLWRAARERGFLITSGLKSNRWLRVEDPSAPQGWRWQRLSDYTAQLSASDYIQLKWPKGDDDVYVHVVTTRVRKLYSCQVVIVRLSLDAPVSQARYWASSDLEASPQMLLAHIAARWDIEVLFADGKEELGLDQYQLMSATALVRAAELASDTELVVQGHYLLCNDLGELGDVAAADRHLAEHCERRLEVCGRKAGHRWQTGCTHRSQRQCAGEKLDHAVQDPVLRDQRLGAVRVVHSEVVEHQRNGGGQRRTDAARLDLVVVLLRLPLPPGLVLGRGGPLRCRHGPSGI